MIVFLLLPLSGCGGGYHLMLTTNHGVGMDARTARPEHAAPAVRGYTGLVRFACGKRGPVQEYRFADATRYAHDNGYRVHVHEEARAHARAQCGTNNFVIF